jgi:GTPase SAR1 family protein
MAPLEELRTSELLVLSRLRALGLDTLVALPRLVVVGDTSSGKSSLLSVLSGIGFPSASTLSTRCPVSVTLTTGDAVGGLARIVRAHPNALSASSSSSSTSSVVSSNRGGSTDEVEPEPTDFEGDDNDQMLIHKLDDIPRLIEMLSSRLMRDGQVISDDHVVLNVEGPTLPNLALTDLPGLVRAVADGEDPHVIPLVRRMVGKHMRDKHAVILAVVPANVDVHNAEILQAAQTADPDGHRTIAVVTKLDLVDQGAEDSVLKLILNRRKALTLGYHAVKCRSEREVLDGVSIDEALTREAAFFRDHPYWSRVPADLRGSTALATRIAEILKDNVRRSLPRVLADVERLLTDAEADLEKIGGPQAAQDATPSAQRRRFFAWVSRYCRQMEAAIDGSYDFQWLAASKDSADAVDLRLRAVLRLRDSEFQRDIEAQTAVATMLDDEESDTCSITEQQQCQVVDGDWVQTRGRELDNWVDCRVVECRGTDVKCAEFPGEWFGATRWRFAPRSQARKLRLKQLIRDNRGDELTIFPSYRVFSFCVQRAVQSWMPPSMALVDAYARQTRAVSDHWIASLDTTSEIKSYLSTVARTVLSRSAALSKQHVNAQLQRESRPYTQDKRLYEDFDAQRRRALSSQLDGLLNLSTNGPGGTGSVSMPDVLRAFTAVFASSEEREALEIDMALRSYMQVAVRRFVDVVPMKLNDLVLTSFVKNMESELMESTSDEQIVRLMQEPPQRAQLRRQLMDRIECLRAAKREILGESEVRA